MTTAEIKALVAKPLMKPVNCREKAMFAAIETLLARQAEVLEEIMFDYSLHSENIRAILNPENDSE